MKRVLVTGAGGFIGRHTIAPLQARGFEVHGVGRQAAASADRVVWHHADLLTPGAVERVVRAAAPTHVLHLAWVVDPVTYWESPQNLQWVAASLDLVRAFAAAGGGRVVVAGTCAEYEWGGEADLSEASTPLRPASLYGTAKDATRRVIEAFALHAGLSAAWGRLFYLHGPHEPASRLVPSVIRALLGADVARCTSGVVQRDYLHVADAGEAFAALLDSAVTGPVNIASGQGVAIRDLVQQLGEICGCRERVAIGALPDRAGDPTRLVADVRRLRDEVGWAPRLSLAEGLRATLDWWRHTAEASARG